MIRQELYDEAAESLSQDMEEMIVKLQRFTEFVMYGIATPSDERIHTLTRHLRGVSEQLNFQLNKRQSH